MMNHSQEVENAVKRFRKETDKIRTSDNPYYHDAKVQEYEIKQKRAELDATIAEINTAFLKQIDAQIAEAETKAKNSRFYTSETQKQQAQHALDSYVADVTLAYNDNDKHEAYSTLERRLDGFSEAELAHVRLQLPSVLGRVNGDEIAVKKLKSLNATLAALKTPEAERVDELKAEKRIGADAAFRRLTFTHPAYSDKPGNQHNGRFMQ